MSTTPLSPASPHAATCDVSPTSHRTTATPGPRVDDRRCAGDYRYEGQLGLPWRVASRERASADSSGLPLAPRSGTMENRVERRTSVFESQAFAVSSRESVSERADVPGCGVQGRTSGEDLVEVALLIGVAALAADLAQRRRSRRAAGLWKRLSACPLRPWSIRPVAA